MRALTQIGLLGTLALAGLPAVADAQPVGSEFQVNTYTTSIQGTRGSDHLVAADASGNFVIVWSSFGQDGSYEGIFGQRYDSGGVPRGDEFHINSFTTNNQGSPSIASDATGNFVVVWLSQGQDGDDYGIFGQRYDGSGVAQGNEFRVNSYTLDTQRDPSVASDASGNFVVVWQSYGQDGNGFGIFGQRFDSAGVAQGDEFRVSSATGEDHHGSPTIASDASGNFVVVWESYFLYSYFFRAGDVPHGAPRDSRIFGQRYDSGGVAEGEQFRVDSSPERIPGNPSVASDASGNFIVIWDASSDIFGQRYDSGGVAQGNEFRVNSYTTQYQELSSVGSDAGGNFVVVWQSRPPLGRQDGQDGSQSGIFGQRYDSGGVAQGDEFQVNSFTTDDQEVPSVGATGTNQFAVVWESEQSGPFKDVFGQRFDFGGGTITVVSPNTNVKWRIGSLERIRWTHSLGRGASFRIDLDREDDGEYEELIAGAAPADAATRGHFGWTVTGPHSATARVRVSWTNDRGVSDTSDVTFQIRPAPLSATERLLER